MRPALGGSLQQPECEITTTPLSPMERCCQTEWYALCMTSQVAVRLPDELISRLDALVPSTHPSRSEAVRRAIELYLYSLACEHDARQYERIPLADEELSLTDDPLAWSGTPPW